MWLGGPLRYYPGPGPKEVSARVRTALPIGSSKEKVVAYLDEKHIEHSEFLPVERRIYAIQRDTCRALLVTCSIDMVFDFSAEGALEEISVKEGLTGL